MKDIIIRRPIIGDMVSINHFFREVLIDTFKKNGIIDLTEFLNEEINDKKMCLNQDFQTEGTDRFFLIALTEDRIVGTIEYGLSNDLINDCMNNKLEGMIQIGTVFVHPQFQYQGIGTLLLQNIFKELIDKGIDEVCLDSGYKTAQKIWSKKFGKPQYFLKDYWDQERHHMVWILKVKEVMKCNVFNRKVTARGTAHSIT